MNYVLQWQTNEGRLTTKELLADNLPFALTPFIREWLRLSNGWVVEHEDGRFVVPLEECES